jgi:hypothetical protein
MAAHIQPEQISDKALQMYYDVHLTENGIYYRLKPIYAQAYPQSTYDKTYSRNSLEQDQDGYLDQK